MEPDPNSTERLVGELRTVIGKARPGDRLPSSRDLIRRHGVSPVTVSRALAMLVAEGAIATRPGSGSFVAEARRPARVTDLSWQTVALGTRTIDASAMSPLFDRADGEGVISLATGYLHPSLMPTQALNAALTRAARLPDAWERPPAAGLRSLRTWFARITGAAVEPEDVIVTAGGQGAINAVFRAVAGAGDPLLVESPTYPGALAVARAAGIRPVPVPCDDDGIIPEHLADAFARSRARALYIQPTYNNPTGTVLSLSRRAAVLEIAAAAGAFVIEDDYARWLSHGEVPLRPLLADDDTGRVVYITSLTKVASPSLRVGAVIARGPVAVRLGAMRMVDDLFVARPTQEATIELVNHPAWKRHLRGLAAALHDRRTVLAGAVTEHLSAATTTRPAGGMHLWIRLPPALDDLALAEAARRRGVIVGAGRGFFAGEPPDGRLRLTFTAAPSDADLVEGVRRLAQAASRLGTA